MQKIKNWIKNHRKTTIVIVIMLILAIIWGIADKIKQNKAASESHYVVAKVAKSTPLTLTGTVVSQQQQVLSLPTGKVQSIGVADGQKVKEGDPLVTTYSESTNEELIDAKQTLAKGPHSRTMSVPRKKMLRLKARTGRLLDQPAVLLRPKPV